MSFEIDPRWNRQPISNSSQIKEVAFDQIEKKVYVVFANKSVYSYSPFTFDQYLEFTSAPSVGGYFHSKVKQLSTKKM